MLSPGDDHRAQTGEFGFMDSMRFKHLTTGWREFVAGASAPRMETAWNQMKPWATAG
jgi:hypothetical protein